MDVDARDDARWMSYDELAAARDINRRSAVRLAQRRRWARRRGNDGTTRVAVPAGEDQPNHDDARDVTGDDGDDDAGDISRILSALEVVVAPLREQLELANRRADQERTRADVALAQLRMAEELLKEGQIERAAVQEALAGAETRLREAEAARAEFWARSRWKRIRAVWRGRG
jgi:hypothetical protein